jgi:hypothetical protein
MWLFGLGNFNFYGNILYINWNTHLILEKTWHWKTSYLVYMNQLEPKTPLHCSNRIKIQWFICLGMKIGAVIWSILKLPHSHYHCRASPSTAWHTRDSRVLKHSTWLPDVIWNVLTFEPSIHYALWTEVTCDIQLLSYIWQHLCQVQMNQQSSSKSRSPANTEVRHWTLLGPLPSTSYTHNPLFWCYSPIFV